LKNRFALLLMISLGISASWSNAGELRSVIITDQSDPLVLNLPDQQFLRVSAFTQSGSGSQRGVVTVSNANGTKDVLSASTIGANTSPAPEFIKDVVIAGPSTVTVNPITGAKLFITYKKHIEAVTPTPTPVPTATVIITPTPTPTPTPP
jgi:hypothetical protein